MNTQNQLLNQSSSYLMEDPREAERLEDKTDPDETRRHLALVGVRAGQRVLDAGGGTGAVSRVISDVVGPRGSVVCFDRSAARLAAGESIAARRGCRNLEFVEGDLFQPPFGEEFDVIWSRFVLEYLPDPVAAVRALANTLKPGGRIVVGDCDGHALFLHPMSVSLEAGLQALFRGLGGNFDPFAGRKLFGYLLEAGMTEVTVEIVPYHVYAGAAPEAAMSNWTQKFEVVRDAVLPSFPSETVYDRFVAEFLAHLRAPDTFLYSSLIYAMGTRR